MSQKQNPCDSFLKWALPEINLRPEGYRKVRSQVCKRLKRRIQELELHGFGDYRSRLEDDPAEWKILDEMTRITISRFFRDRKAWDELGDWLLPGIINAAGNEKPRIRCWSAGCASGEEPYSLSILWMEKIMPSYPDTSLEIIATDADPFMIERARQACYTKGSLREVPEDWVQKAFYRDSHFYCLEETYRQPVYFQVQDIRRTMPEGLYDVVFCKNLAAMYFNRELANAVFKKVGDRMKPGAYLVLGNHEELDLKEVSEIRLLDRGMNLYRKVP
jgi:chemotaxis protein methyltransferase CheR